MPSARSAQVYTAAAAGPAEPESCREVAPTAPAGIDRAAPGVDPGPDLGAERRHPR